MSKTVCFGVVKLSLLKEGYTFPFIEREDGALLSVSNDPSVVEVLMEFLGKHVRISIEEAAPLRCKL